VHIEIVVEGTKQRSGETNATPDVLGESARQLLGALDIPVDDAVPTRHHSFLDVPYQVAPCKIKKIRISSIPA
jgi:hypothetical protein